MTSRTKKIIGISSVAMVAVGFGAVCWRLRSEPSGAFHSYSIFAHDPCDRLVFSGGTVTLYTCCGNASYGTYQRRPDGTWLWTNPSRSKNAPTMNFVVHPGVFSITFIDTGTTGFSATLRRRLFETIPY